MVIDKTKGINNLTHWYVYKRFLIWTYYISNHFTLTGSTILMG